MTGAVNMLELNRDCNCFPITHDEVSRSVLSLTDHPSMQDMLTERENYFAATPVFIGAETVQNMQEQIVAIEAVMKLPAYKNEIYHRSALASFAPAKSTQGAFMGYDFHITDNGPRLIEINSNAGGAFIVNAIEKAVGKPYEETERRIIEMFLREWNLAGRDGTPSTLAIIDENPEDQFHYPDMLLAADLFRRHGLTVKIIDSKALEYRGSAVFAGDTQIDLIYNRLTDFSLEDDKHQILRQAWLDKAIVMTPDPRHHATYADKRNLTILTDRDKYDARGVKAEHKNILGRIPKTINVTPENAESLWWRRKDYFFKPYAGFGSRAVYKGAKLTKKVWAHILKGGYVAQEFVPPPTRLIGTADPATQLKYDVRVYSYAGEILSMAARVYQGQVTNLRTAGGGLAPIIQLPNQACRK